MNAKFDYLVVLGMRSDQRPLSALLVSRLNAALSLYRKHFSDRIIVSGGGLQKERGRPSEAEIMKRYLVRHGIRPGLITLEESSFNTISNALFTKEIIVKKRAHSFVVVTSDFHLGRTRFIFRKVFGSSYRIFFVGAVTPKSVFRKALAFERISLKNVKANLAQINEHSSKAEVVRAIRRMRRTPATREMKRHFWY
jgi:uncharacterized SAM-binding protein YcdF (DUF218 family)